MIQFVDKHPEGKVEDLGNYLDNLGQEHAFLSSKQTDHCDCSQPQNRGVVNLKELASPFNRNSAFLLPMWKVHTSLYNIEFLWFQFKALNLFPRFPHVFPQMISLPSDFRLL